MTTYDDHAKAHIRENTITDLLLFLDRVLLAIDQEKPNLAEVERSSKRIRHIANFRLNELSRNGLNDLQPLLEQIAHIDYTSISQVRGIYNELLALLEEQPKRLSYTAMLNKRQTTENKTTWAGRIKALFGR